MLRHENHELGGQPGQHSQPPSVREKKHFYRASAQELPVQPLSDATVINHFNQGLLFQNVPSCDEHMCSYPHPISSVCVCVWCIWVDDNL